MEREFNNLSHLRSIGFSGYPHYVARPLGRNASLNCVLVEEFCYGTPLDDFILRAIREGARETLFEKLTALAYFLATLHNRTATAERVDINRDCSYFDRIMDQLKNWGHIGWGEAEEFHRMKERWREKAFMWEDNQVLVHGDVTPTNILFGDGLWVIAIDLERMKPADRVFDVGRVAAEIKHLLHAVRRRQMAGGTLHRALPLGVRLPLPGPGERLSVHHPPRSLPHGDDPPAHRPQLLDHRCIPPAAAG